MRKKELTPEQIKEIKSMWAYRKSLGMSQVEFAEAIGVSRSTIVDSEESRQPLSQKTKQKIEAFKAFSSQVNAQGKKNALKSDDILEWLVERTGGAEKAYNQLCMISRSLNTIYDVSHFKNKTQILAYIRFINETLNYYASICEQGKTMIADKTDVSFDIAITEFTNAVTQQKGRAMNNLKISKNNTASSDSLEQNR